MFFYFEIGSEKNNITSSMPGKIEEYNNLTSDVTTFVN